jgi:hypothetical protein
MKEFSSFGGSVTEAVLAVTHSETLHEAVGKLKESRAMVVDGVTGPIDGVEPWESADMAAQRLDHEIGFVEDLILEAEIEAHFG